MKSRVRENLATMSKLAEERGGKFLSKNYKRVTDYYLWECNNHHRWKTTAVVVKRGSWCPTCSIRLHEMICRRYLELIFGTEFRKTKPIWLVNNRGNKMELDGYAENLNIAFEYQGPQHFRPVKIFTNETLENRREFDRIKVKLCAENNVKLIVIPTLTKIADLPLYIGSECKRLHILVNNYPTVDSINKLDIYTTHKKMNELRSLAIAKGGKLLSDIYLGSKYNYTWECSLKHKWCSRFGHIRDGSWCPTCAGNIKATIRDMLQLAAVRKGKCLSLDYVNDSTKLEWKCQNGHSWWATPSNIKRNKWCPKCACKQRWITRRYNSSKALN